MNIMLFVSWKLASPHTHVLKVCVMNIFKLEVCDVYVMKVCKLEVCFTALTHVLKVCVVKNL